MLKVMDFTGDYTYLEQTLHTRKEDISVEVNNAVTKIINDIRINGDDALMAMCEKLDGFKANKSEDFLVTEEEINEAVERIGPDFIRILERAKSQLIDYHQHQVEKSWSMYKDNGVIMGQLIRGIENVALYVPGGTATYPSTVMMNAIPASLAGVKNTYIITPVKADGKVSDVILAAAYVCDIKTIYKAGGAHGVAAAAYGTKTIQKADKIVGPGNIYVATAKKLCYGVVDIDMVAGPSEIMIVADETANPRYVAADLMSQAEHDVLASAILITTSRELVAQVNEELKRQIVTLPRQDIIASSLENYGGAIIVKDIKEGLEVANHLAPEHLEILTQDPLAQLPYIQNAGSIFLGEYTPEPLGDYLSGTNHVLPTGGTAKFYSALGVYDFVKHSAYSYYPKAALASFADDIQTFAHLEGLDAHANSIKVRFEEEDK
ncbi:MAG: histidinol dehydrogenase [Erysipelotrichaceae bacterium]|nr:histidinol dehydrogenase [Erysipelotrichaceae bacterium]